MTKPHRIGLIGGLVLLLSAIAWLWFESEPAVPLFVDAAAPSVETERADAAITAEADAGRSFAEDDVEFDGSVRTEAETETPVDGRTVRVVDDRDGSPIAGAEVFAMDADELRRTPRPESIAHWNEHLIARTNPVRTDAAGRAVLPGYRRALLVAARTASRFGVLQLNRRAAQETTLALRLDETLVVRAIDSEGEPVADLDILLATTDNAKIERRATIQTGRDGYGRFEHVWLFRKPRIPARIEMVEQTERIQTAMREIYALLGSDIPTRRIFRGPADRLQKLSAKLGPAQKARIEAARVMLDEARGNVERARTRHQAESALAQKEPNALPPSDFVVMAGIPELSPAVAQLPNAVVPKQPVVLRLNATGALTVALRQPDGSALRGPCRVTLRTEGSNLPPISALATRMHNDTRDLVRPGVEKRLGQETVRFERIGVGMRFRVAVRFADRDFNFRSPPINGPVTPGEDRLVEVTVPEWFTMLSGRIRGPDGERITNRVELMVAGARGRIEGERLTLEADGRFELPIRLRDPTPPYTLEVGLVDGPKGSDRVVAMGKMVELPKLEPGHSHDLGLIQLDRLPIAASGRVVDDRGEPVAQADIALQVFRPTKDGGAWRNEDFARTRTDKTGRYELLAAPRSGRMRLFARSRRHVNRASDEIEFGASVDLQLQRTGFLIAQGQLPRWLPRSAAQLFLRRGDEVVRKQRLNRRGERFTTRIGGILPGSYDVTIELRGVPTPVLDVRNVRIDPGDPTRDPRLSDLDLRTALHRYVVRAVDQSGQTIRSSSPILVQLPTPNGGLQFRAFPWRGGRVEFVTTKANVAIALLADGHLPLRVNLTPGEHTLHMHRLQPIRVSVPGLRDLVGADRRVRISLVYDGHTGLPMEDLSAVDQRGGNDRRFARAQLGKSGGAWLGEGDRVEMRLMLEGRYEVVARIYPAGRRGRPLSTVLGTVMVRLTGTEVETVTTRVDPRRIRGVLDELARRTPAPQPRNGRR